VIKSLLQHIGNPATSSKNPNNCSDGKEQDQQPQYLVSSQEHVRDEDRVPGVPAGAADVVDVARVHGPRNLEDLFLTVVAAEAPGEVARPGAHHDGGVGYRQVPPAGGGSTQTGNGSANDRVSRPPHRDEVQRVSGRRRRRDHDPGFRRSVGKYDRQRRAADDVEIGVSSSIAVQKHVPDDVATLDVVHVIVIGRQQPRIFIGDERFQLSVSPETVSELFVHGDPRLGASLPPAWYFHVLIHHVYDTCVRLRGTRDDVVPENMKAGLHTTSHLLLTHHARKDCQSTFSSNFAKR